MTAIDDVPTQTRPDDRPDASSPPRLAFAPSLGPLLAFLLVTTIATPVLLLVGDRLLPRTALAGNLFTATAITATALFAWVILRREGVSAAAVGLDRERILSGVVPVAAIWIGVNVFGYVLLVFLGEQPALGVPADPMMGIPVGAPLTRVVGAAVTLWIFVGIAEEFAFRGYLQNKVVALLGPGRARKAVGIVSAAVLFALWHVPVLVSVQSVSGQQLLVALLFVTAYTVVLGTVYELTRNVVLVGLFHGTFDFNPIFVVGPAGEPVTGLTLLVLPLAIVAFWAYRRWAKTARPADFRPREVNADV